MIHKKIANAGYEDAAAYTTRTTNRSGLTKTQRAEKRRRNRAAKRQDAQQAFKSFESG